jgi:D-aminopeptidase
LADGEREAILSSLVANQDMTGRDGNFVPALPRDWLYRNYPPRP